MLLSEQSNAKKTLTRLLAAIMVISLIMSLVPVSAMAAAVPVNGNKIVDSAIPSNMNAGEPFAAIIEFQNTGTATWTTAAGYKLVAVGGSDPFTKYTRWAFLEPSVAPGATATFVIPMTAPLKNGKFTTDWQMYKGTTKFGAIFKKTVTIKILPVNAYVQVTSNVPDSIPANSTLSVNVSAMNIGSTKWTVAGGYAVVADLYDASTDEDTLVTKPISGSVSMGSSAKVTFNLQIPLNDDDYSVLFYMVSPAYSGGFGIPGAAFFSSYFTDAQTAQFVIDEIAALPAVDELTLADKDAVEQARADYDDLSVAQQALVTNYSTLQAAEAQIADLTAAQAVSDEIAALPAVDELAVADKDAVRQARDDYDALTANQKSLVTNLDVLVAAEAQIADLLTAQDVIDEINALPAVDSLTLDDKSDVQQARADYEALSANQKSLVPGSVIDVLAAAEIQIANLTAAKAVSDEIAALPAVDDLMIADKAAVQEARADYDALSADQQAFVTNLATLTAAEAQIAALEKGVSDEIAEINALPAVDDLMIADKAAVQQARADYAALTDEQQGLVSNLATLTAAEAQIVALEKGVSDEIAEINALPAVDDLMIADKAAVQQARADYAALTDEQQGLVSNLTTLTAAEAQIVALEKGVSDEIAEINALPAVDDLMIADKAAVQKARADYAALTDEQQGLVSNLATLTAAEAQIAVLEKGVSDEIAEINALPAVGDLMIADKAAVQKARADYAALTDEQQGLVSNLAKLTAAEAQIAVLEKGVSDEIAEINALPALGALTLTDKDAVVKARADFSALTAEQQDLVTNLATLTAAEKKISDMTTAKLVSDEIAALPALNALTLADKAAVQKARTDYTALTADQQVFVTNLATLTAAEKKIADMTAAKSVSDEIAALPAIGALTLADKDSVVKARTDYNALTADQKAFVTNLTTLTAAETKIADLTAAQAVINEITSLPATGALTLANKDAVQKASDDYVALTATQKSYVPAGVVDTLNADKAQIVDLTAAKGVADEIAALPATASLTLANQAAVVQARADFNALTNNQKSLVPGAALNTLAADEAKIASLQLSTAQASAVSDLKTALSSYDQNAYSIANWAALTAAEATGEANVNAAASIQAVTDAKNAALLAMSKVKTLLQEAKDLSDAQTAARENLAAAYGGYVQADYSGAQWTNLRDAYYAGRTAIDTATSVAGVASALSAGLQAMDDVPTALEEAQAAALAKLDTAYDGYDSNNYYAFQWNTLTGYYNTGKAGIENAKSIGAVNDAEDAAEMNMRSIETKTEVDAEMLADAQENAHDSLNDFLAGYNSDDYYPADWTTLTTAKDNGDDAIDDAGTPADVTTALNEAEDAIRAIETKAERDADALSDAKIAAHEKLDAASVGYNPNNYYEDQWIEMFGDFLNGHFAIEDATTIADVNQAESDAEAAMAAVKTKVQVDADTLAAAKLAAHQDLSDFFAGYNSGDYYPADWTTLTTAKDNGDDAIDEAGTPADVTAALDDAINAIQAVPTTVARDAVALAAAQSDAQSKLEAAYGDYDQGNYYADQLNDLIAAYNEGSANINDAMTIADVNQAESDAEAAMAAVKTMAQVDADTLAAAKVAAHQDLSDFFAGYNSGDYYPADWTTLTDAKDNGDNAIDAAGTPADVTTALDNAMDAIDAVPTAEEMDAAALADAQSAAQTKLEAAYGDYDQGNYYPDQLNDLIAAYNEGSANINDAMTIADVNQAESDAEAAMAAVLTKDQYDAKVLADAKTAAHSALDTFFTGLNQADYRNADWTTLTTDKSNGDIDIDSAASTEEVTSALQNAEDNISADSVYTAAYRDEEDLDAEKTAMENKLNDTFSLNYDSSDYFADQWNDLVAAYDNGAEAIDSATMIDDVDQAESDAEAAMAAVETKADVAAAQVAAQTKLMNAFNNYKQADYDVDEYNLIFNDHDIGSDNILNATTVADVNAAEQAAEDAMASVPTLVDQEKASKLADLATAYSNYSSDAYSTENFAAITAAYNTGVSAIHAASMLGDVGTAYQTALDAMADVKSLADEAQDALNAAKNDATATLYDVFTGYNEDDYSAENYQDIENIDNAAYINIENARTIPDVTSALNDGLAAMDAVQTLVEEKRAWAQNELASYYASFNETLYNPANWTALTAAYLDGLQEINADNAVDDIAWDTQVAENNMSAVETLADQAHDALVAAQAQAHDDLNAFVAGYQKADYYDADWTTLTEAKAAGDDAIDAATSPSDVATALSYGESQIEAVKTAAERALDALNAEKASMHSALQSAFEAYDMNNYYAAQWTALTNAKNAGDQAIDAAGTELAVDTAEGDAEDAMAAVQTKDLVDADVLAAAKTSALQDLADALSGYDQGNYSDDNWATLTAAKTSGDTEINNASTPEDVTTAENSALSLMAAVETIAQVKDTQDAAHATLASAFDNYSQSDYTLANWNLLVSIKTAADAAIDEQTTSPNVLGVLNGALNGMDSIKTISETDYALQDAKDAAHYALLMAYNNYQQSNYYPNEWTALTSARTTGDTQIDAAATTALARAAKNTALTAMAAVKTKAQIDAINLANEKTAAITALSSALSGYDSHDYTGDNWTALNNAESAGEANINNAATISAVDDARDAALQAMANVHTIALDEALALAAEKTSAHNALQAKLAGYSAADYSAGNWETLTTAKVTGDTNINAAATIAAVDSARDTAISAMEAVHTLAADAAIALAAEKTSAHNKLDTAFAGYAQANYSDANWATLTGIKSVAGTAIDNAATIPAVDSAESSTEASMAALETKAQEAADLANAKSSAHSALNTALASYYEFDYSVVNWTALNKDKTDGDAAIEAATTIADANSAKTTALNAMDSVLTFAEQAAQLANAKVDARTAVLSAYAGYHQADYSDADWTTLTSAKNSGLANIDASTSVANVTAAKNNAIAAMHAVETIQDVLDAQSDALVSLSNAYHLYDSDNYDNEGWDNLVAAYNAGVQAIDNATSISDVTDALASALTAMSHIAPLPPI